MSPDVQAMGSLILILFVGGIALSIAWLCVPFMLFGTKPLLRQLLREHQETNRLLRALQEAQKKADSSPPK